MPAAASREGNAQEKGAHMSYGIIRIAKVATGAIGGAQIHNERKSDHSNTNPDIDFSRSENNRQTPSRKGMPGTSAIP